MSSSPKIPFLSPNPPRLSLRERELRAIEDSGTFSNFGPQNARFEKEVVEHLFGGEGACLTVCNATIGLMLAIRDAILTSDRDSCRYALMPSFTFAATPHAAIWCRLTPVLYDVEPDTWLPSQEEEHRLLRKYGSEVAVVVPYATFGNSLDLVHYEGLAKDGIPIVVDAAASLGTKSEGGTGFGKGFSAAVVFSLHATKTFATSEGGLIYSGDPQRIKRLRAMSNFGFTEPRVAHLPGLNAKMAEIGALSALCKLQEINEIVAHRLALYEMYVELLPELSFQTLHSRTTSHQFVPALLPRGKDRNSFISLMFDRSVGIGKYFDPHVAAHPYFRETCVIEKLPVTEEITSRIVSLPLFDRMTADHVRLVCTIVRECLGKI